jgi:hypothetical protein
MSVTVTPPGASDGASDTVSVWLSVTEAAGVRHTSERTVWRWIRGNRVVSRVTDGRREVRQDSLPGVSQGVGPDVRPPSDGPVGRDSQASDDLVDRISELSAENARLWALASERLDEVTFLRERVREAEKAAEQQRILALRTCEALERSTVQAALPPPARRPWWRWRG